MIIEIPPGERGQIRVFAVNRSPDEIRRAIADRSKTEVAGDLIGQPMPEDGFEFFPTADLTGVGLSGYLGDGYAVPAAQLREDRRRLDALEGYVLLVFSNAFDAQGARLEPRPDVTLIGTYGEAQPDMSVSPVDSDAARPYSGTVAAAPPPARRRASGGALAIAALVVVAALVLWLVLA